MGYREVILATPGLQTYHRMSGGVTEASLGPDTAVMTHTGSPTAAASLVAGGNQALAYNGSSQYSKFTSAWASGLTAMSLEFWFKESARVDWSFLFALDDWPDAQFGVIRRAAEDNLICNYSTSSGGLPAALTGPYKPLDRNYVGLALGAGVLELYVNGKFAGSQPAPGSMGTGARDWWAGGARGASFNGVLDELATYNVKLSAATFARHYKAGLAAGVLKGLLLPV